ncbi:integrase catalytic domain-containing protein [Trichonephila inaurata madagascariensis]|uniref:Integrase catalytic domain-containing protein n=1 Tax=Trichonephila inaurata madagascariensis TaxID=2747483 RepID=A0A8X6X9T2_9ARAC|nr:integrase catalytic domain-containing protein [Trichonephila inaurata madagascariensis]
MPVFNASSHVLGSPSLNDCLSTRPNLIEIIPTILNRFRRNYIGVTSNIEKAFLQISIREKDRDYLRFLWLVKDDLERVEEYRHRRVVFGLTCSSYLLAATLQYHLIKVEENLSYTSEILKTAFYVDNCITSLDSELEMRKFILESQIIMSSGNFNLRGWKSNFHSVEPIQDTTTDKSVSILGLVWHTDSDMLSCKLEITNISEKPNTKRLVLALAHQGFDSIGFKAPVTLIPKLILQETWNLKLRWDDTLPDDLLRKFKSWYQQLHFISDIRIPRWFNISPNVESVSLHLFTDASQKAFDSTLSVSELKNAEIALMHLVQKELLKNINDDKLKQLRPIIDCNGLIRAKTNVSNRDDTNDFRFPIILPSDHTVVKLLIMNAHNDLLHAGTSMLMSHLREKYWIIKARKTIRKCIRKCVKCPRFKTKKYDVTPGILPKDRVHDAATFETVGVDLVGPLYLKHGSKAYSVGEIVLLEDNRKKRAYWSLARVLKLIPGRDGHKTCSYQDRTFRILTASAKVIQTGIG